MAISETKMQIVIANYFKDECDVDTSIRQAFEKGFRIGVKKGANTDRPQGEWIWNNDAIDWNIGAWICSNCHVRNDNIPHNEKIIPLQWSGSKFCPNCGADMRKGADDES